MDDRTMTVELSAKELSIMRIALLYAQKGMELNAEFIPGDNSFTHSAVSLFKSMHRKLALLYKAPEAEESPENKGETKQ